MNIIQRGGFKQLDTCPAQSLRRLTPDRPRNAKTLQPVHLPARIWIVSIIQFDSVDAPLDRAGVAPAAARALGRAEAMGLLSANGPIRHLDLKLLTRLLREVVHSSGVGRDAVAAISTASPSPERISTALRRLFDELEQSPVPEHEWRSLLGPPGPELPSPLGAVSVPRARRYPRGDRTPPQN